jgi:hypothetical protein
VPDGSESHAARYSEWFWARRHRDAARDAREQLEVSNALADELGV